MSILIESAFLLLVNINMMGKKKPSHASDLKVTDLRWRVVPFKFEIGLNGV